jgi:flagellar M-ring protein FliF
MPSLDQAQKQVTDFVKGLGVKQRLLLAGTAVVTAAVLAVFVHFLDTPDFKPLMTGMEPADAQALASRLAAKSISYEISPDGKTVSVPADKLDSSRLEVAGEGMPHSGRLGFELFDKLNWGQTEFDEKVNYQRALEGELERTIQTLRDVESVRVHLVMPADSVFLDREREAKASVILRLHSGQLSQDTERSIAGLVAGAVDKLSPQNVVITDADTNQPFSPRRSGPQSNAELEDQLSRRLVSTLEPVVGAQRIRASVNVDYDTSSSEENQETYDPKSAVAVTMQTSEEKTSGGDTTGGVPGTASNVPNATTPAKSEEDDSDDTVQSSKTQNATYAVDKVVRHILQPVGRIRRISAALLIDDAVDVQQANGKTSEVRRKRTPEELKQIEVLAAAAIGLDEKRGDTLAVQNLSFQQSPQPTPAPPSKVDRIRIVVNDWSSLIRYAVIFILFMLTYVLLLRPIKKQALSAFSQLPNQSAAQLKAEMAASVPGSSEVMTLSDADRHSLGMQKQLTEKARSEPAVTGRLVQAWLREGTQ